MNPFPSSFKTAAMQRVVKYVPLLAIQLPNDINGNAVPTGYISDRDITVGGNAYVRKLLSWDNISQDIKGDASNPSFTLSNVDRVLEAAAQLYFFAQAQMTFMAYLPAAGSVRIVWTGYCTKVEYDYKTFKISAKDGYFSLSQPIPRRRATFFCDFKFDDGLMCPYSGYGNTGAGSGLLVTIASQAGVVGAAPNDFGQDITPAEGYHAYPGFISCPKTFPACKQRGMWRFYGGLRYVSSWSTGYSRGFFSRVFGTNGTAYNSYSQSNSSIYNQAIPVVYTDMGYVQVPPVFQFRAEKDYIAGEALVSAGTLGQSFASDGETLAIGDIYMNGKPPHQGQHPTPLKMGVIRGGGKIGDTLLWDAIGGDMKNTDTPGDPPVYFSGVSGVFIRVKDTNAGINNPQYASGDSSSTSAAQEPSIQVSISQGRNCWVYLATYSRSLLPTSNCAWVYLDVFLDALDLKYTIGTVHSSVIDMAQLINCATFYDEIVASVVDGSAVKRYRFSGEFSDLRTGVDQLDAVLQDCASYRFWRNGLMCVGVYADGGFDSNARPGFQEFVNIVDGSLTCEVVKPEKNEYQLTFGNADYGYQKSVATVFSESYQVLVGTGGRRNVESQSLSLTGTPTIDQATRVGALLLKNQLGGTTVEEWQTYRKVTLKTGFFMSELEIGDITYIQHSLIPGGGDWFRVQHWSLASDWSVMYTFLSHRSSVYDDSGAPS